jgi:hypothetical protein
MTTREHPEGITELVDALLEGYAPISVLLDIMFASPGYATVGEVRALLGAQLRDVLEPLAMTYGEQELKTAAELVAATVPLIHEGLHFLPPGTPLPGSGRHRRRGGRRNARRT